MNIVFVNWNSLCAEDICNAFIHSGHHIYVTQLPETAQDHVDEEYMTLLQEIIKTNHSDMVFSMNYYPTLSIACEAVHCPYVSWIYDNPQLQVYDKSIINECNYIFSFDSHMVTQLESKGVHTIYYAPLAANVRRLTEPALTAAHYEKYSCDVSFVGSLYNEDNDFYSRLISKANNPYLEGYLEGVLSAQKNVYGYNFMSDCLNPQITEIIRNVMPYLPPEGSYATETDVYADYYLARKLATINRVELLHLLGNCFDVHFYTHKKTLIPNIKHCGVIHYYDEMPYLFRISKINLNISLRSIKNGIPLRGMDILGCGGFLLSNYQEDFLRHFEPDTHLVLYDSFDEALDKTQFYLTHEQERNKIRTNALELMSREHTYEVRLQQMLKLVFSKGN